MTVRQSDRGQLPKAYLRFDPDIDVKHPDNLDGFVRLLCAGNRTVPRGRFRNRAVLDSLFGKTMVDRFVTRGDIKEIDFGAIEIVGWDHWQEGDLTVAERMRAYRSRKSVTNDVTATVTDGVTTPYLDRNGASEALGRQGVKASSSPDGEVRSSTTTRRPSALQTVKAWLRDHEVAQPVGWQVSTLSELTRKFGPDAVIASFEEALSQRAAVTCANFVRWAEQSLAPNHAPRNGSPKGHTRPAQEAIDAFTR